MFTLGGGTKTTGPSEHQTGALPDVEWTVSSPSDTQPWIEISIMAPLTAPPLQVMRKHSVANRRGVYRLRHLHNSERIIRKLRAAAETLTLGNCFGVSGGGGLGFGPFAV